ncbi:Cytochrome P450 11B, mitochondrial [Merluccius polli]|uniref:steroid 11beta-monooxygenase n=1 Tax=Merluccius polli TaxID=89951 RepID=A0AA47MFE3_MERPO|nr:Cytochrome P450 11B, mitochondrial [Merluccius polli]
MQLLGGTTLNTSIHMAACGRLPGRCASSGHLGSTASRRALCTPAAAAAGVQAGRMTTMKTTTVVVGGGGGGQVEGRKKPTQTKEQMGGEKRGAGVRAFEEIPHTGRSGWLNLLKFWREGRLRLLHTHMERTFNALGPIYREHLGTHSSVNIMMPGDIGELFRSEGLHPRRMTLQPWATHRETRQHQKGVFLKNGEEWRSDRLLLNREVMMSGAVQRFLPLLDQVAADFSSMLRSRVERDGRSLTLDPSPDLFRFALEASCHVIYGERIGLFSSSPSQESQRFIWAVERMLSTTPPLLYLPPRLLSRIGAPLWTKHATAWDHIFSHAEARIQKGCQRLSSQGGSSEAGAAGGKYTGVLGQLMEKGQLSLDLIKANVTELMAGGVDTTAVPLQFALYELGRNPQVQETVRQQVRASWAQAGGDPGKALQGAPLLKGTVKEILRLYPVGITVQRYPIRDIVLQNYHIPAGTMVQVCLYPLGRNPQIFHQPKRFDPTRWGREGGERPPGEARGEGAGFRSLAFGFGARQCVGRRIAENEMQLFLMHILLNFRLTVSSTEDIKTTYTLILQPETPPQITFTSL